MKLEEVTYKVKCDMPGCKNVSSYMIVGKHFILSQNMYLCKDCLQQLYSTIGKLIVPKSPKNVLNNKK